MSPSDILDIRTKAYNILRPLASQTGLMLAEFDAGIEMRLRSANKEDAVRTILSEIGPEVPVAYLGDDTTDEGAFRVLRDRGLAVLVGPKARFTAAQVWLKPPAELIGFLASWIRAAERH
jgi:trehalose-phosphatase